MSEVNSLSLIIDKVQSVYSLYGPNNVQGMRRH
jgi:hypothetical protein